MLSQIIYGHLIVQRIPDPHQMWIKLTRIETLTTTSTHIFKSEHKTISNVNKIHKYVNSTKFDDTLSIMSSESVKNMWM